MMLQNAHGPIPIATFHGDRRSLGFVLVLPSPHRPRGKRRLFSVPESPQEKSSSREVTRQISRTFSFNWFCLLFAICYLLSYCVAFFNRECLGETRSVSKVSIQEISPKEKEAWEHFSLDQISKKTVSRFPYYKTLLWTRLREEKELIQKSKGRRKNMPRRKELLRWWKKAVFWKENKFTYKNQKKLQIKRPKPKINCLPPLTKNNNWNNIC